MIDLDTLEQDALHLIDREALTVQIINPHTIAALIRVVRAAEQYREAHINYMCQGPDGQCEWRCPEAKELDNALTPFRT